MAEEELNEMLPLLIGVPDSWGHSVLGEILSIEINSDKGFANFHSIPFTFETLILFFPTPSCHPAPQKRERKLLMRHTTAGEINDAGKPKTFHLPDFRLKSNLNLEFYLTLNYISFDWNTFATEWSSCILYAGPWPGCAIRLRSWQILGEEILF